MMTTMSPSKFSTPIVAAAVIFCIGGIGAAVAQPMPNTENGHYSLSPVAEGVIRLDTRTGAVSTCTNTGKIDEPMPKTDSLKKPGPKVAEGERKIEIPLPSDHDMDRMMSFLEQAWRRLVEMANRMQKDVTGKI